MIKHSLCSQDWAAAPQITGSKSQAISDLSEVLLDSEPCSEILPLLISPHILLPLRVASEQPRRGAGSTAMSLHVYLGKKFPTLLRGSFCFDSEILFFWRVKINLELQQQHFSERSVCC